MNPLVTLYTYSNKYLIKSISVDFDCMLQLQEIYIFEMKAIGYESIVLYNAYKIKEIVNSKHSK